MTTNAAFKACSAIKEGARVIGAAVLCGVLAANAYGAATALGSQPFVSSTKITALPNVMFVLDDSGSMQYDYLPDWAGPLKDTTTGVTTPEYKFFNGSYNGVAYNPATRYRQPVMYTTAGVLDTSTYPHQTGQNADAGGNASASATAPNWLAVKKDGFGVQFPATDKTVVEGNAYSYTTIAGEYCTSAQLRTCVASAAPTGAYTFPAKLRWCDTLARSLDTTANAGTHCQANYIADKPTSAITVSAGGTVSSITVGYDSVHHVDRQILSSASVAAANSADLATAIASNINACTVEIVTGSHCTVVGYSAVSSGNVVTITAPVPTSETPVIAGVAAATTSFGPFARMPRPHSSTLTVGDTTAVTSVTVGGVQLLSAASVSGATTTDLAAAVAASINVCSFAISGSVCKTVGYRAVSQGNIVTISAPQPTNVTPLVVGGATTTTPFGNGNVPGSILLTVITPPVSPAVGSYPYPGSAAKDANRTDCAGSTCTYVEEMTNYANWYAYYRTRMQMMKTASSIAFSAVDDKFRVGYYSINNGAHSQFLNVGAFDGAQKNLWYTKFLSAKPTGATPLRTALATVGQMYAGQLSTLNGVTVSEPMQYSCQQNFTILSTDGYWNDSAPPTRIDRATPVGQQDGNLDRPYYDGGQQDMTVSQILQSFQQKGKYEYFVESQTRQLQTNTSRLLQSITTTTRQPWEIQTSHLQTRTKDLTQNTYNLESRTYRLATTKNILRENTFKPQSTTYQVIQTTNNLQETTTYLTKKVTKVDRVTNKLQVGTQDITSITSPLQIKTRAVTKTTANLQIKTRATTQTTTPVQIRTQPTRYAITPVLMNTQAVTYTTTPVQKKTQAVTYTTTPVQIRTQAVTATTSPLERGTQGVLAAISPLQSTTTKLASTNYQLYKGSEKLMPSGDKYYDFAWAPVTTGSCATFPGTRYVDPEINVICTYLQVDITSVSSCTPHAQTTSSPYTALTANTCAYELTATTAPATTCTVANKTNTTTNGVAALAAVTCAYGSAGTAAPVSACVQKDQTNSASMSGDKTVCSYDPTVAWAAAPSAACSPSDPNYASAKISCRYGAAGSPVAGACIAKDQTSALATNGASISGNKVECGLDTASTFADATGSPATCTPRTEVNSTGVGRVTCQLGSPQLTQTGACTGNDPGTNLTTVGATYKNRVVCGFDTTATFSDVASGGSCTPTAPATAASYAANTPQVTCQLGAAGSAQTGACTANDQGSSLVSAGTEYKAKVVCGFFGNTNYTASGTCKPTAAATPASYAANTSQVLCKLAATASTPVAGTCVANLATTAGGTALTNTSTTYKDKVECSLDPVPGFADATNSPRTCTPSAANYATAAPEVTCQLATAALAVQTGACTANLDTINNGTALTAAGTYSDKVVCGLASASFADVGGTTPTCTPRAAIYSSGTSEITCQYGSPGGAVAGACVGNDQSGSLTSNGTLISGNQVVCGLADANFNDVGGTTPTCSPRAAVYSSGTSEISCQYGNAGSPVVGTCVGNNQTGLLTTLGATISGNKVVCDVGDTNWVDATGSPPTCTPNPVNFASNIKAKFCRYNPTADAAAGALAANLNQDSCQVYNQPTNAAMSGNQLSCNYHATLFTDDANASSCTEKTSTASTTSGATVNAKTDCAYSGTSVSASTLATCTKVPQTANPSTNGVTSSGPAKECAFVAATSYPASCTQSGSASPTGTPAYKYDSYVTCALDLSGHVDTGLDACVTLSPGTGPNYASAKVDCTNTSTSPVVSTDDARTSCTFVAPAADASVPYKTCTYAGASTTYSTAATASCTHLDKGTGTTGTFHGPAISCAYVSTPYTSLTNTNASSCTPHRQSGPDYSGGPAVDCVYNASASSSQSVASCSNHDDTGSSTLTGAKIACVEGGAYGSWGNVTVGNSCTTAGQSGPTDFTQWRDCRYTDPLTEKTYGNACTELQPTSATSYNVLTPVHCVAGSYQTAETVDPQTVDSCSTAPTQTGDTALGTTQVNTATTCNYEATPTVAAAASCAPSLRQATSPYTTEVICSSTVGPWTKLNTSCSPVGVQPAISTPTATVPAEFAGGVNTACRTTDVAGSAAAFAPTAECNAGVDGALLQTQCSMLRNTTSLPVDPNSCVATDGLPTEPDYVKTICTPVVNVSTVMNCAQQTPLGPLWKTTTCVDKPNTGTTNTLADVAAYYYYTDLRTWGLGNCTGAVVPPATTASTLCSNDPLLPMNNVPVTSKDPNSAQHMTTFTLGLGASGYMNFSDTYLTDHSSDYWSVYGKEAGNHTSSNADSVQADPGNGVCSWQASGNCNWPYPASDEQTTIDDLWHAGVNGHGAYFSATDPKSLSTSISGALAGVAAAGGSSASPTISNPNLSPNDNYIFSSGYVTMVWSGELTRRQMDPLSGVVSTTTDWAVQAKLDANASRNIYTFDAGASTKLKEFTSANFAANVNFLMPHISTSPTGLTQFLCASADTCLSASDQDATHASGANLVDFLRGARTNEGVIDDNVKYYRQRTGGILGDMVNAQPVYVNKPLYNYADMGYSAFIAAQASRQPVVYAGANDGMLHAFAATGNAATEAKVTAAANAAYASSLDPSNTGLSDAAATAQTTAANAVGADPLVGQEMWAYIPTMVIPELYRLADKKYKDHHRYYVDATPVVGDICVSSCTTTSAVWKTILVGGLGGGGRGYYALDITVPASPKALWEFTDDNLGYSYGNPQIVKKSDGTWVVLLTSGYNNIPNPDGTGAGDGVGRLFVLNAATGAQIAGVSPISTGVGSGLSPSGLAKISAQVVNPTADNTVEAVYGGDLYGNLWRFDINNTIGAVGYDAQLLAILKDGEGHLQPITTKPEVAQIPNVNANMVYVGTGRFLDASDATDTSQQSFYAIKDVRATGTAAATAIFDNPGGLPRAEGTSAEGFVRQVHTSTACTADAAKASGCTQGTNVIKSTDNTVDLASDNGWFFDLVNDSERANTDPTVALGLLAFNTNAPSLAACDIGGKSYQYFLDYLTGGPIHSPGNYDAATDMGYVGKYLAGELASAAILVVTKGGDLLELTRLSGGTFDVSHPPLVPLASITRRTGWRELIREQ